MNNPGFSSTTPAPDPDRPPENAERSVLDWAREEGEADRLIDDLAACLRRRQRRRTCALATCAALGMLLLTVGMRWRAGMNSAPAESVANAVILRPETRTLPDGSIVELNAGAAIEVDFTGTARRVTLRQGEAHFQVAPNTQRPFVVAAAGVEVRAVGTAFSVELGTESIEVLVTEGTVAVEESAGPRVELADAREPVRERHATFSAGKRVVVELTPKVAAVAVPHVSTLSAIEMGELLSWRVPRLEFSGTPLSHALPMFNQHGLVRLTLADPTLGQLQLSGVLRADDTESLLRLLEGEFGLVTEKRGNERVLRRR